MGDGVARSFIHAFHHYEKAMELGSAEAMVKVGSFCLSGFHAAKIDHKKAFNLFEQACKLKAKGSAYLLGRMLLNGDGCSRDLEKGKAVMQSDAGEEFSAKLACLAKTLETLIASGNCSSWQERATPKLRTCCLGCTRYCRSRSRACIGSRDLSHRAFLPGGLGRGTRFSAS